jgi:glycosyltransferase involved in cell wall biosynthesis
MPKVTVIIPNYNHGPYLRERIESVINQTFRDIELILIDDCSTDNSREIIQEYEHHPLVRFVFYTDYNTGSPYSQWPVALKVANAEWIWVAESDDLADPRFLEKMVPLAIQNEKTSLVYCDSLILSANNTNQPTRYATLKNNRYKVSKWNQAYQQDGKAELNECLKMDCTINNVSAVLFRKSMALEAINNMDGFRFHGDWMFYISMAEKGQVVYLPEALNQYREHSANHSKSQSGNHFNKPECFYILQHLLQKDYITDKKELIHHFIKEYIGFGFRKEKPFSANGLYRQYQQINPRLARLVLWQLIKSKIIPG